MKKFTRWIGGATALGLVALLGGCVVAPVEPYGYGYGAPVYGPAVVAPSVSIGVGVGGGRGYYGGHRYWR